MVTLRHRDSIVFRSLLVATVSCGSVAVTIAADEAPTPLPGLRVPRRIEALDRPAVPTATPREPVTTAAGTGTESTLVTPVTAGTVKPAAAQPGAATDGGRKTTSSSGFKQWLTERMAALPKSIAPAAPTPDEPAAAPAAAPKDGLGPVTAQPETKRDGAGLLQAPVAVKPDELPTLSIDQASFRGALPGKTARRQLESQWGPGEPFTAADGTTGGAWRVEPFERVEVTFAGDTVAAIRVKLAEPVDVNDLARQLEIADLRTVSISDDQGAVIGQVYPERGVVLSVKPDTQTATAILIEPLDAESFTLRAEQELESSTPNAIADLQQAITLDPEHVRAYRLLLGIFSEQGKWKQAQALAERAVKIDPADAWTQLKRAGVLLALDRPADARAVLAGIKARENLPPLVAAQTERLLGRAALAGKTPDHKEAVERFAESIRRATPLLAKRSPGLQSAAREVLLDAHLGTAEAIANGTWQQKARVIPKWIGRAETLVKEFKGTEAETQVLELQLCRGALTASAGSIDSVEPLPWVRRLLDLRDRMSATVTDPWRRRQLDWEVGRGLADALAAAQKRGDDTDVLENATLTAAFLERGAEQRELTATERHDLGELMFRIGILHSLQRGDHATAVTWFDRTVPLWEGAEGLPADGDPGRRGESLVSMAISYWQVDRRDDALTLSRRGAELMVAAVDARKLEERALAVAYGNLSTMYAEEGDDARSRTFAEMASRAEASGTLR